MTHAPSRSRACSSRSASSDEGTVGGAERPPARAKTGSASSAAAGDPYRVSMRRYATGPTPSARASRSRSILSAEGGDGDSCFLTNARLGACDQAADVRVMTGEHQHGDQQRKLNDGRVGQDGGNNWRERERSECGEG